MLIALLMGGVLSPSLRAESVSGTVVIKKKLTRSRVTAAVPLYQRGTTVELTADLDEDPLAAERTRVVVYIEGHGPATPVVARMEQQNRRFAQETVVVPVGSKVTFPNLDPIFHNVFSLSKPKTFDLGNYPKGETRTVVFTQPGIVYVNCHLHTNMTGTIVVTPNDWYTKADKTGHFVLPDLPPGKYTVVAWHKTAGYFRKTIELAAGESPSLEFLIPVDVDGSRLVSKMESGKR
jgi:plastocyanin